MGSGEALLTLLHGRRVVVLSGAGVSTASGIPDYRGPETRRRARNPVRFAEYVASEEKRARYWARSMVGWERFSAARPNAAHQALASMERAGVIEGVLTQNVDRLHQAAGSASVVELHGALAETGCLDCGALEARSAVQTRMRGENPAFAGFATEIAPDGDVEIPSESLIGFVAPRCQVCQGTLKPNVVFFGENVRPHVLAAAYAMFDRAEALLVVGSSLAVFSGYRFVRRANDRGMPIAIVNLGESRADALAKVRIDADCTDVLPELARALGAASR